LTSNRIGIDLGGTKIEAIILSDGGEITHRLRVDTPKEDYDQVLEAIRHLILNLETEAGIAAPLPIGIGTPGTVSYKTGLMKNCNSTCLNGKPLRQDLEIRLGRPIRIANDADCFTLSEAADGAARDARVVFGVILGTGVGGGICIRGELVQGINAISGEWGHNPVALSELADIVAGWSGLTHGQLPERQCYCGRRNCVESWLSGPAFELGYETLAGSKKPATEIVKLARQGDSDAVALMDSYHRTLALALSNVINILDPEVIVLGGGMSNINSLYSEVPANLSPYVFSDRVDTRIVKAMHGDSGGVRGAAWLW
jgi:fructokinase